jgi:superfamily I DNA/RNA helicase
MIVAGMTKEYVLTPEQQACVNYDKGDLLVKGVAGSGKSLVLLMRAADLSAAYGEKNTNTKIAFFTYANTLVMYSKQIFEMACEYSERIEVTTLDKYCSSLYYAIKKARPRILSDKSTKENLITQSLQRHFEKHKKNHRFYEIENLFWIEEFKWIKEKGFTSAEKYYNDNRNGRGGKIRMAPQDKVIAYELFLEYCNILKENAYTDWEDLYIYVLEHYEEIPQKYFYDYVLVDEAQDFSYIKLRLAKKMCKKCITIAADQAQKIYNTSFTWSDIGIDIRGKASKTLGETFRSTKQIVQLADSILLKNKERLTALGEYTDPILPVVEGPMPIIKSSSNDLSEWNFIIHTLKNFLDENKKVIGILCRNWIIRDKAIKILNQKGITFETVDKDSCWSLNQAGIKIITMHSAKGLEVDYVIIPSFNFESFPPENAVAKCDNEQQEELVAQERSLLYVGMTRARQGLLITYSGAPSSLLAEMDKRYYDAINPDGIMQHAEADIENVSGSKVETTAKIVVNGGVKDGDTIRVILTGEKKERKFKINLKEYKPQSAVIGKQVGEKFRFGANEYTIIAINS